MALSSKSEHFIQIMKEIKQKIDYCLPRMMHCKILSDSQMDTIVDYFSKEFYISIEFNKQVKVCMRAFKTLVNQIKDIDRLIPQCIFTEEFDIVNEKLFEIKQDLEEFYQNYIEMFKTKDRLAAIQLS